MGILEDGLSKRATYNNYRNSDQKFTLERFEHYCGGKVLNTGVVYLVRAENLPETVLVQDGAGMICIGMPEEFYTSPSLSLLVIDNAFSLSELTNEVSRIFCEYNALEHKLQESVNNGRSIQYMVEQIAPYFNGNELEIVNGEFRVIGISNTPSHMHEMSGLEQPDSNGTLSSEVITFFKNDINFTRARGLKEPFIFESSLYITRGLCINIFHHEEPVGRIVLGEDRNTFRGYEAGLLQFFATFIQLVFEFLAEHESIVSRDHLSDVFADLLHGESIEDWRLENSISHQGWRLSGPYCCASIMPSDRDYYNRTIPYYCQTFNHDFYDCRFLEHDHKIVCVANLEHYSESVERFISTYRETFRDGYFRVGYSNIFTDIKELRYHYLQANVALKTGLKCLPSQWFYKFPEMALYYIDAKLTEELDGRFLCAPEILTLYHFDQENKSDYLHTLKTYLSNQLNAVKTAKDLFIHRNTMEHRLRRIVKLTGIDFNDYDRVFYLEISIRLLSKDYF